MPSKGSFYAHIIFATKGWHPTISGSLMKEITQRLERNFKSRQSELLLVKGKEEHIHIFGKFTNEIPFSEVIGWSKGECSHWINQNHPDSEFHWQKGFWYETLTEERIDEVKKYILEQELIHKDIAFSEEITRFRREME